MSIHDVNSMARVMYLLGFICLLSRSTEAQVYQLAELRTDQILALDREKTVIVIPGGILEEHGPYLPSYADGYVNERLTADLAGAIAQRPGWAAVVFPVIPLGAGGANEIGAKYSFPGTYAVRPATLRAIFMDLAMEFGEQGFRWIFVVHRHGGPSHNRALDEAGDYFRDTYGGRMVNLTGLLLDSNAEKPILTAALPAHAIGDDGFSVHAYLAEHSEVMALRPDLVPATVTKAPSITGKDFPDLMRIARSEGWPGYFGAPRYATAELGRRLIEARNREFVSLALRMLDGLDDRQVPRYVARVWNAPGIATVMEASAKRDAAVEERQQQWLAKNGKR
jgi:creatinine amidohydrolase/Fe(II)-dependent formamide hydrolase-like protein